MHASSPRIFISHAPSEYTDVRELRLALEDRGLVVVVSSPKARESIQSANALVILLSAKSIGNDIVQREVQWAIEEHAKRTELRLIVLLRGLSEGVLPFLFKMTTPISVPIPQDGPWVEDTAKRILEALGLAGKDDHPPPAPEPVPSMAELMLEFSQPKLVMVDDKPRASAIVRLRYSPAAGRGSDGVPTEFVSPLSHVDSEDLRWYIESYCRWPWGPFKDRARVIETKIPQWGQMLFDAIVAGQERPMREFLEAKAAPAERLEKRITVHLEYRNTDSQGALAAALLLGLPWELLHDDRSYLFDGAAAVRVRRTLPSETARDPIKPSERVRVLYVRARPEGNGVAFIDPRSSARPLAETLSDLGDRVQLDVLPDGTFAALGNALRDAEDARDPYHIVHFDGHGKYNDKLGQGELWFEDAEDLQNRSLSPRPHPIAARELGGLLRDRRVPLFVLDACQSGMAEKNVDTSVAAELLRQGVASVVAMRYAVLVPTAKRFVQAFYGSLAEGHRIGRAMLDAQRALKGNAVRSDYGSRGRLELQDWMVPVLFQEDDDPQLFMCGVDRSPSAEEDRKRVDATRRGELRRGPDHGFVGRARDLLQIERHIVRKRRLAIRGAGGEGKTALAIETANWFLLAQKRERIAFVSVERLFDARAVLDAIGRQLVPGYSVAMAEAGGNDPKLPVKSALMQRETLLVVDNFESLLALAGKDPTNEEAVREVVELVNELANVGQTWLITTSREPLREPLNGNEWRVDSLNKTDAQDLLVSVLRHYDFEPPRERKAAEAMEILRDELIEAVRGHARSLVLLGPTIVVKGLEPTREAIRREMIDLEKRHPGDRENSLLASVRVSLARLEPATRQKIAPLCLFRQAAPLIILPGVLGVEPDELRQLLQAMVDTGLADVVGSCMVLDPALVEALDSDIDENLRIRTRTLWREGLQAFTGLLYYNYSQHTAIVTQELCISLVDLLEALEATATDAIGGAIPIDVAMKFAVTLEPLVASVSHSRAIARTRALRESLAKLVPTNSRARFLADMEEVNRRVETGRIDDAIEMAAKFRDAIEAAGNIYPEWEYDCALAWAHLGRGLRLGGRLTEALETLVEAQNRFSKLATRGAKEASNMDIVTILDQGDAHRDLGRLEDAATAYEETAQRAIALDDIRSAIVARERLGTIRLMQGKPLDAVRVYLQSLQQFEEFGEPYGMADAYVQIGNAFREAREYAKAEYAYTQALNINVAINNRAGEATALGQLGTLLNAQERFEEACNCFQQAITIHRSLGNAVGATLFQNNLAIALHQLRRLDEARAVLKDTISGKMQLGHVHESWKTWATLYWVECDAGRPVEAAAARREAINAYRAYRIGGGEPIDNAMPLIFGFGVSLKKGGSDAARAVVQQLRNAFQQNTPAYWLAILRALDAIVSGNRDAALLDDPELLPVVVAELQLLLESLPKTA